MKNFRTVLMQFTNDSRLAFWADSSPLVYWLSKSSEGGVNIMTDGPIIQLASASGVHLEVQEEQGKITGVDLVCKDYCHMVGAGPINSFKIGLDPQDKDIIALMKQSETSSLGR